MVSINYAFKEIISKIVYYGPGLSGKTTNLQYVFKKVPQDTRGELISLATDADRTLYFDFLPVNVGNIRGFQVKFQLYTVPGQVYYNATRKLVLRGVDGLVFVADSQVDKMDENLESLKNLEENLAEYGYSLEEMPFIIQYNKRDLPNIASIEELEAQLNPRGVPFFEAVATTGTGVFGTLKAISKIVIDKAQKSGSSKPEPKAPAAAPADSAAAKPKPEPVAAMASSSKAAGPQAEAQPMPQPKVVSETPVGRPEPEIIENEITEPDQPEPVERAEQPAYGELADDATETRISESSSEIEYDTKQPTAPPEKPAIMRESETLTNVVVSDTPEEATASAEVEEQQEDIEETTEHAVLNDETDNVAVKPASGRRHPDVLDADKLDFLTAKHAAREEKDDDRDKTGQSLKDLESDVADPKQSGNVFHKPQMAESKKVKGKNKAGLFGWLKKKN